MALQWVSKPQSEEPEIEEFASFESVDAFPRRIVNGQQGNPSPPSVFNQLLAVGKGAPKPLVMPEPGEPLFESLIGVDERTRVLDTETTPWRMICALRIEGKNGVDRGTGWLAGPRTVITAGHCVFDPKKLGGWARSIEIAPGRNDDRFPEPAQSSARSSALALWVDESNLDFDIGVIHLDQPLGDRIGWFGIAALSEAELESFKVNISGYPIRPGAGKQQWFHENRILRVTPKRIFYDVDTLGGQSGAPVWIHEAADSPPLVVGVHAAAVGPVAFQHNLTANSAPRITPEVLDVIEEWINLDHTP